MSNQIFANATTLYGLGSSQALLNSKWENEAVPGEFSTDVTMTVSKTNNICQFLITQATGTTSISGTLALVELMPELFRPEIQISLPIVLTVAGTIQTIPGMLFVNPDGTIKVHLDNDFLPLPIATYLIYQINATYPITL